ncbi:MAG: flavin oxidoreductase/NADH oxidase [Spirochaetia bacterium]|nr:flavin oxidoreductase/NADH oxidase [Spirochaetia bacterium]
MAEFKKFALPLLEDLENELKSLGLSLPISQNTFILGDEVDLGKWKLPNRFIVQPMEGIDGDPADSSPSELTFRRYRRFAEGGAGLIWFEAVVVEPEGKSNPRQLMITRENLDVWKRLVDETREAARKKWGHEIVTIIQIAHSGRWSKPDGNPKPVLIHHNPQLDRAVHVDNSYPLVSDDVLDLLQDKFIDVCKLAAQAGFDGIEFKAVHGYFTGEMLCAYTREGKYGGSYENRTRFVRECTARIADSFDSNHFVTARLTMYEPSPFPYGWGVKAEAGSSELDLTEPLKFARELVDSADMPLFNYSIGYPRFGPYITRPYNNPISGVALPPEHPLEGIVRFQQIGKILQGVLGEIPVATAALGWLRHHFPYVAAGLVEQGWITLIGQGRGSIAYPDSVEDILKTGTMNPRKCCITCSLCSQIMKDVVGRIGCPVRDGEIYKPELQKGRASARLKGLA